MRKIITILAVVTLLVVVYMLPNLLSKPQVIVVGHNNRNISIIDIESKEVVWQYPLPEIKNEQCNSVTVLSDGKHIAFSTQLSAKVVNLESKELVWEHKASESYDKVQIHSVVPFEDGGFAIFTAGTPVEILEVSKDFEITNKIELTSLKGTTNPHGMFRQVSMSSDGNYLMPWFPSGDIYKISRSGKIVDSYAVGAGAFAVRELPNGNILFGTGDTSTVVEYDMKSREVVKELSAASTIDGDVAWLQYLSQSEEVERGKYMVANWIGHSKAHQGEPHDFLPILMIMDIDGNIEWSINEGEIDGIKFISGYYYSDKALF